MPQSARPADAAPIPSGTVAFLFTDIEGSTQRWERYRDATAAAVKLHDALLRGAIESHSGYVFKTIGDAFCAAFPTVRDAIGAALEAQRALAAEDFSAVDSLKVRMSIHVGHADERDGDYFGPTVNRVARLLAVGYGGQVLVSGAAADLVQDELPPQASLRDLGAHRLKDLTQPEQVYQLVAPDLQQQFFALKSLESLPNNLPLQVTSFVGRETDAAEIARHMGRTRLLTLVGTGGVGKTRLALQTGADLLDRYADGVWYVEFAPLVDATLIPNTVGAIFGITDQPGKSLTDVIVSALRNKAALLIFDNCEHVVAEAAAIADALIRGCPKVQLLATSREGLGISGETVHRVASLSLPPPVAGIGAEEARAYAAVALFAERAAAANTRFELTDRNATVVADVCRRLDGIALAIELAATRLKVLSIEQLAAKLDERFRLLTGGSRTALPRQQTMRALIDWSYDLLGDAEKAVFRRVAVFAGGWTLEAAGEICSDDAIESWDVLDLLGALVDKSMVVAELADGEQRYRLLESTRQYASEKLGESGEREHLRGKHAAYYLALLREAEPSLNVTPMGTWIAPLAAETDNFRLALDWYLTDKTDPELGAELIALLIEVFSEISRPAELWRWLVVAHGALGESGDPALRARLLGGMSAISDAIGMGFSQRLELAQQALAIFRECGTTLDIARATVQVGLYYAFVERITEATPLFEEGLELARRTKDRRLIARALAAESYCLSDLEAKRQCLREATALYRAAGDDRGAARTQSWLAEQEFRFGDVGAALAHANESIAICRRRRFRSNLVVHLVNAAAYHLWIGAVDEARDAAREAIGICQEIQDLLDVPICIQHLAGVAQARGDAERAARLLGFTDARFLAIDEVRQMTEKRLYDRIVEALLGTLGADELRAHMAAGALLGEDEAIDEALRA